MVDCLNLGPKQLIITYNVDGVLRFRTLENNEIRLVHELKFGSKVMEALKVYRISNEYAFMFIGGYESKVHVYSILLSNFEVEY